MVLQCKLEQIVCACLGVGWGGGGAAAAVESDCLESSRCTGTLVFPLLGCFLLDSTILKGCVPLRNWAHQSNTLRAPKHCLQEALRSVAVERLQSPVRHVQEDCLSLWPCLSSVLQLALKDPVHTVSLQQFIYEKLKAQQEILGEQGFQSLMETVDTEIVTQLQEFLQGF